MTDTDVAAAEAFIARWQGVTASELSTSQSFLIDLCELLDVPRPHPTPEQDYMFERLLTFQHADGRTSPGRVDLYRRGASVLESKKLKQGAPNKGFDEAALRALAQAQNYARALPCAGGRPPFPLVVELKKGRASDVVVGQTLRYMGFVQEELAEAGQQVRGVIIALEDDPKIRRALQMTPSILFYRYEISFKLVKA